MRKIACAAVIAAGCFWGTPLGAQNVQTGPEIIQAVQHDVSPALRDIAPGQEVAGDKARERPLRLFRTTGQGNNNPDPVLQSTVGPNSAITPGAKFAGVGLGDYGFTPNAAPPDTNGSVGATQYVQWVNESFAVFDKSTHALLYGPAAGNTLWSGFGGGCQNNNDGDPVAMWDKAAQRWVMTQFSISTTPYLQCVAVSATSDATGAWYRYAFQMPYFNDYPKLGVWPDAYYMSFNMFSGNSFVGGRACALDRTSMLAGGAATAQCFQLSSAYGGLLPSDLDGSTAPPSGSPNFFVAFGTNDLQLWKFHVDWTTPANSTFAGPTLIPVASFSAACNGGGTCIPQLGTSQKLDSLADRLMFRLAYRNFGDHESLVVNHAVTAGSSVGVRWYELRSPNGTPAVYQQGTYAPDSNYRWMGSVAMDGSGDIALGYSESSSGIYPEVAYAARVPGDPLGTLEAETVVQMGGGSQNGGLSRWGDYSAMSIDPVDDCTFWYTNEYLKQSGSFNWSTIIGTFKVNGCGTVASPDFSMSASPVTVAVTPGGASGGSTVTVTSLNGFSSAVGLTVSCPTGLTCTMTPTSVTPASGGTATSALSVSASAGTAAGNYTATVTGTSETLSHSTSVTVAVQDFSVSANPTSVSITQGQNGTSTISVTAANGFSGSVALSATGCPTGATCSFSPSSVNPGSSSTLTVATTSSTPGGTYTVSVTGTSGTLSHSTGVSVTVTAPAPDFTISANPTSVSVNQGQSGTSSISVTAVNGFTGSVSLGATGCPTGATCSFSPSSVNPGSSSTLTVATTSSTPGGTYTVTVTGTSGTLSHSTNVPVTVVAQAASFTLGASPASLTVKRNSSGTTTVTVTGANGFNGSVSFSVSGLGRGTSASFKPTSVTGSGSTTLTFKANKNALTGTFTVTITGSSSGVSPSSTTVSLTIQ